MRLIPDPPGKIIDGEIKFKDEDLIKKTDMEMQNIRGNEISMIFQEPMTALNPVFKIGEQIAEVIILHESNLELKNSKYNLYKKRKIRKKMEKQAFKKAIESLKMVNIPDSEKVANQYPHELSGGMRQRAMIAMMLACDPDLLIADEPTTALDVTVQAQILALMKELQKRKGTAIWLITHNLGIIAEMCDRVGVMYAGYIVEMGSTELIFDNPDHPYTRGLMGSIPKITEDIHSLEIIPGNVPNLIEPPSGCRFHPRCKFCKQVCKDKPPKLQEVEKNHFVSCHRYKEVKYSEVVDFLKKD